MDLFNFLRGKKRAADLAMPTVQNTATTLSARIEEDLRLRIQEIPEIDGSNREIVYEAVLRSIAAGRDLYSLSQAILECCGEGITKKRAREIAGLIHNAATAMQRSERQASLGISRAVWRYSGAPCMTNPKRPTAKDIQQDQAHRAADGKTYEISKGLFLAGVWTIPGRDEGCRCSSTSVIPGLD